MDEERALLVFVIFLIFVVNFVVSRWVSKLVKSEKVQPSAVAFTTQKTEGFPRLRLSVSISDENQDNLFEGRENIRISITAKNVGTGVASGVKLLSTGQRSLEFPKSSALETLPREAL
jgi:hypothetical protein